MKKKILFWLHKYWYVEAYFEYIFRYLGNEFIFDMGIPDQNLNLCLGKDPSKYDLIVTTWSSTTSIMENKILKDFSHKAAVLLFEPAEGKWGEYLALGSLTKRTDDFCQGANKPFTSLRMGVDTNLFKTYPMASDTDKLVVGYVGTPHTPRRQLKDVILPLKDIEGVELKFFIPKDINYSDIEFCGGEEFRKRVAGGHKQWVGIPNIYNSIDVLLEPDADSGYSFPVVEAAACGVPFITTDGGIERYFTDKHAGFLIIPEAEPDPNLIRRWYYDNPKQLSEEFKKRIIYLRDNPDERVEMGFNGRKEIEENWTWDKLIPAWRDFLNMSLALAK